MRQRAAICLPAARETRYTPAHSFLSLPIDLLGKRSPLGAIWQVGGVSRSSGLRRQAPGLAQSPLSPAAPMPHRIAAHQPRKLNRARLMAINVSETWCVGTGGPVDVRDGFDADCRPAWALLLSAAALLATASPARTSF